MVSIGLEKSQAPELISFIISLHVFLTTFTRSNGEINLERDLNISICILWKRPNSCTIAFCLFSDNKVKRWANTQNTQTTGLNSISLFACSAF